MNLFTLISEERALLENADPQQRVITEAFLSLSNSTEKLRKELVQEHLDCGFRKTPLETDSQQTFSDTDLLAGFVTYRI